MNNFIKKLILTIIIPIFLNSCINSDKIKPFKGYNTNVLYFKCTDPCHIQYVTIYNAFQLYNITLLNSNLEKNEIPLLNVINTSETIKKIEFSNIYNILEYQIIFKINAELSLNFYQNIPINITMSRTYFDQDISSLEKYQERTRFISDIYKEALESLIQKCTFLICNNFFNT